MDGKIRKYHTVMRDLGKLGNEGNKIYGPLKINNGFNLAHQVNVGSAI